jgi:hypothetical protein
MLLLDQYLLLAGLSSARVAIVVLFGMGKSAVHSTVEAPSHFLAVHLTSAGSNLNMNYYILFGSVFQWCMTLNAGSMGWGMHSWLYIVVQCARRCQTPELHQGKLLHTNFFLRGLAHTLYDYIRLLYCGVPFPESKLVIGNNRSRSFLIIFNSDFSKSFDVTGIKLIGR